MRIVSDIPATGIEGLRYASSRECLCRQANGSHPSGAIIQQYIHRVDAASAIAAVSFGGGDSLVDHDKY